jgi:hypothetical protein
MQQTPIRTRTVLGALGAALFVAAGPSTALADLLVDGGFDDPVVTTPNLFQSGFVIYNIGQSFGGPSNNAWTVVTRNNAPGNVALTPTSEYTGSGTKIYFNAHSGPQHLDLTGSQDNGAPLGVAQTFATTPGATYSVSLQLARFFNDASGSVTVAINGTDLTTFTNAANGSLPAYLDGVAGNNWQAYSVNFTATGTATTLGLYNAQTSASAAVFVDSVSVTAVPEPTLGTLAAPAALLLRRRRR